MTLKKSQTMGNLKNVDKPIVKKASSSTPNIKVKRDIAPRTPDREKKTNSPLSSQPPRLRRSISVKNKLPSENRPSQLKLTRSSSYPSVFNLTSLLSGMSMKDKDKYNNDGNKGSFMSMGTGIDIEKLEGGRKSKKNRMLKHKKSKKKKQLRKTLSKRVHKNMKRTKKYKKMR